MGPGTGPSRVKAEVCPSCYRAMEAGYLVTESLMEGAKWLKVKTRLALGGETLAEADNWGNVYLNAFRCNECRRISVTY